MKLPNFISANFKMGIANFVRLFFSMLKAKLSAILLGPEGVGIVGLVSQVQMFSTCLASVAIGGNEIVRSMSRARNDPEEKGKIVSNSLALLLVNCGLFIFFLVAFRSFWAEFIFHRGGSESFLYPLLLTVPAHVMVSTLFMGIFFSHNRIGGHTLSSVFGIVAELSVFVFLVKSWGIKGALWSTAVGMIVWLLVAAIVIKWIAKEEGLGLKLKFQFDQAISRKLIKSGLIGTSTGLLTYGANVFFRSMFYKMEDTHASGHYHVAVLFSSIYLPFLTNAIWASLHPKVSAVGINDESIKEWKSYLVQLAMLGGIVQFSISLMSPFFIRLLYTGDFIPAAQSVPIFMLGDYFYLLAQPGIAVFLSLERNRDYFYSLAAFNFVSVGVSFFAIPTYGVTGAGFGYLCASFVLYAISIFHLVYRAGLRSLSDLIPPTLGSFFMVLVGVAGFYSIRSLELRLTLLVSVILLFVLMNIKFFRRMVK